MVSKDSLTAQQLPPQHVNDQIPIGKKTEAHKIWAISDEAEVSKFLQNEDRACKRSQIYQERN